MAGQGKGRIAATVLGLAQPVAEELGLLVWDVEFVKEGGTSYLRIFIDSPEGITVEDTERMFRRMDTVLDEADPISESYCLEVSSPGVEREIRTDAHLDVFIGEPVRLRLFRALDGAKELIGTLEGYDVENLRIGLPEIREIPRSAISRINAYYDYSAPADEE